MMNDIAKPFLKWAGGKSQLIQEIQSSLPIDFGKHSFTYVEPFVGSGAVLFWMLKTYPKLDKAIINDINEDLINTYRIIASQAQELTSTLQIFQDEFHAIDSEQEKKKEYFYDKRALYNQRISDKSTQAALFIFLNKTCFNGLYRVNRNNGFNVPMGAYKKPTICDKQNIVAVSNALQKVELLCDDFEQTLDSVANEKAFFYFDPPYKPLSQTSSFNAYAKDEFDDAEQIRLRDFCQKIEAAGHQWMLSNSDVKGKDLNDTFFDDIYAQYSIARVNAKRSINAHAEKRGELKELLIISY